MYDYMKSNPEEGAYRGAFDESRRKLRALDPLVIEKNTGCVYDEKTGCFSLVCFGQPLTIPYPDGDVFFAGTAEKPEISWRLIALNYFSRAVELPLSGRWISYKDQPRGAVFYPNIRKNVIEPMGVFYDRCDPEILKAALPEIGFSIIPDKADLCAQGFFAPRIPARIQFWAGDEDFPGAFQLLFDATISEQMHIEDSVALCSLVADLVQEQYHLKLKKTADNDR